VNAIQASAGNTSTGPSPFALVSLTPTTASPCPASTHSPLAHREDVRQAATSVQLPQAALKLDLRQLLKFIPPAYHRHGPQPNTFLPVLLRLFQAVRQPLRSRHFHVPALPLGSRKAFRRIRPQKKHLFTRTGYTLRQNYTAVILGR
jgi:hypothetical protein